MADSATEEPDDVSRRLDFLARDLDATLGDGATVERNGHSGPGASGAAVTPRRADALAVTWIDFGDALQVEAGHNGGVWGLGRGLDDVEFLEEVVRSVVAGRVVETFGPARSRVEVTLSDGSKAVETGYTGRGGCVPRPGWRRRGRRVQYAPYR